MGITLLHNGEPVDGDTWNSLLDRQDIIYGALSGFRRFDCDIAKKLPAGEIKPVTLYNVPIECEPMDFRPTRIM